MAYYDSKSVNSGTSADIYFEIKLDELKDMPYSDIFGYLMASLGMSKNTTPVDIVFWLYQIKDHSAFYTMAINSILYDIIVHGDIADYMECLTKNRNEFITTQGEIVRVLDKCLPEFAREEVA